MRTETPVGTNHPEDVMSFDEIGARLGISHARAWQLYHGAMKKLKRNGRVAELQQLVALRAAQRRERVYPQWL